MCKPRHFVFSWNATFYGHDFCSLCQQNKHDLSSFQPNVQLIKSKALSVD